jgi:hypothetical protein
MFDLRKIFAVPKDFLKSKIYFNRLRLHQFLAGNVSKLLKPDANEAFNLIFND